MVITLIGIIMIVGRRRPIADEHVVNNITLGWQEDRITGFYQVLGIGKINDADHEGINQQLDDRDVPLSRNNWFLEAAIEKLRRSDAEGSHGKK